MRYGNPSKKTRTLSSTKGHTIEFPGRGTIAKGDLPAGDPKHKDRAPVVDADGIVYIYVPAAVRAEADAMGMQPEENVLPDDGDEKKGVVRPEDPDEVRKQVFDAFDLLVKAGDRESFGGNGTPKAAAVAGLLGYTLTNSEVKDFWPKYQVEKSNA